MRSLAEKHKPVLVIAGLVFIVVLAGFAWRLKRFNGPDQGFKSYTGIDLPPGTIPLEHTTRLSGNFMHETHYWMLNAPAPELRGLAAKAGLQRSDVDARDALKEMDVFDGSPPEFREGFAGRSNDARGRWLIIIFPGDQAIFAY
jgi:hypothetical protein